MAATVQHLSVIPGERPAPAKPNPQMMDICNAMREAGKAEGWSECLAAYGLSGDPRPRRSRPAVTGARPDLHLVSTG